MRAGGFTRGVEDVAGNALDGEFYGFFPSGNQQPGGDFVAELDAVHNTIFSPLPVNGFATPNVPPGSPALAFIIRRGVLNATAAQPKNVKVTAKVPQVTALHKRPNQK